MEPTEQLALVTRKRSNHSINLLPISNAYGTLLITDEGSLQSTAGL